MIIYDLCGRVQAPSLRRCLSCFSVILLLHLSTKRVAAEENKNFHMQTLCKNHFLTLVYRKIEGAAIWSQNERNLDCINTFQTNSILQRFMLRFDMLQLDCNDHLYIFDGAHATGTAKYDLSCRNTRQTVGAIFTQTNFITLKYVTDGWGTDTNGFKLVITAVKDPKHACKTFRCASKEVCIDPDLVCDGVNHCGDNSDESICQNNASITIFGLELTWFVLLAVCTLLVISACIVGIAICFCRRNQADSDDEIRMNHTNHESKYHQSTLQKAYNSHQTTTLPLSGNLHHPAGHSRYNRKTHELLMAKIRPILCPAC